MKIATIADLHVREKDLDALSAQWEIAERIMRCERVDALCLAGDLYDSKRPTLREMDWLEGRIRTMAASVPVIAVTGNHEKKSINQFPATQLLWRLNSERIHIDRPCIIVGDVQIDCQPWLFCEEDKVMNADPPVDGCRKKMLLGHLQIEHLYPTRDRYSCFPIEEIEAMGYDHIALGDYHKRGIFVGAFRQLNFGEEGNPQGFEVWDSETGALTWHELDGAPRYWNVVLESPEDDLLAYNEPGYLTKVKTVGWVPSAESRRQFESSTPGNLVEPNMRDEPERESRGGELPKGILQDKAALIELWDSKQDTRMDAQELERLIKVAVGGVK